VVVFGDQLSQHSAAFDAFDPASDAVWMAEVGAEAEYVWSHKARIALFLSAMRHFRDSLRDTGLTVHYRELDDPDNRGRLEVELADAIRKLSPRKVIAVQPGAWRVKGMLRKTTRRLGVELDLRSDGHFMCPLDTFSEHVEGRKRPVMEYFYREMRRRTGVLMEEDEPTGGKWNYDADNRRSFGKSGPRDVPETKRFPPDETTREVIRLVETAFAEHPGSLDEFDWPVTPAQAESALQDFVENRLSDFGPWQDAMWTDRPFLYHSRLASSLNLKLLDPRRAVSAAEEMLQQGSAPLNSVEGFVRQVLGWREYVRGIYWTCMPEYAERNELEARLPLPDLYWTAETEMNCLRECIRQTMRYGYAHHIQRLMVTGLFALLLGVEPKEVHRWYLAVYVDAVEWVELPNTLGMSQFADGGIMGTKPYAASGAYIRRMSNYCDDCRYEPRERTGEGACPFTTLYWDFLLRHRDRLRRNRRMALQLRNLDRLDRDERGAIVRHADELRGQTVGDGGRPR
jgi:deoxyribodipyrimidine photolyase-related protein